MPILTPHRLLSIAVAGGLLVLAPSAAADPTKDECIAANESAQDLRQAGKLREARQTLTLCVAATCPRLLREDCAQRVSELDAAIPAVVFDAKDGAGNDVAAVHVTMDGQPFAQRLDGTALPADPGEHRFEFEADGLSKTEKTLVLREGEKNRHERVVLGGVTSFAAPGAAESSTHANSKASPTNPLGIPTLAYVAFGVGVVGLGVGSAFGIAALSDQSALNNGPCPTPATCRPGTDLESLHTHELVANVGFGVGLAGAAVGVILWLLRPTSSSESVHGRDSGRSVEPLVGANDLGLRWRF